MLGSMLCVSLLFRGGDVVRRSVPRIQDSVFQALFQGVEAGFGAGMQNADIADFLKAFGQHVLQETAEEFQGRERHRFPPRIMRFVAEGDCAVLHGDQSPVGQGDPGERGCQVCQSRLTIADRLAMHGPACSPGVGRDLGEECGSGGPEGIAELGPEHRSQ